MMSPEMKAIWWEHWKGLKHERGLSKRRIEIIGRDIFEDRYFWADAARHGADRLSPEEMRERSQHCFDHCVWNMTAMVFERMRKKGLIL